MYNNFIISFIEKKIPILRKEDFQLKDFKDIYITSLKEII
jgi:hypothetical protein